MCSSSLASKSARMTYDQKFKQELGGPVGVGSAVLSSIGYGEREKESEGQVRGQARAWRVYRRHTRAHYLTE